MFKKTIFAGAALLASLAVTAANAQSDYPNRPITMVVAFAAGGSTDIIIRTVADKMSDILGQPIVIENRGGADGNVAAEHVVGMEADGYTVLATTNSITINVNLYQQSYHPLEDFDTVAYLGDGPNVVVVHPSVKANTLDELVAVSKDDPLFFAATASGTWMATELFKKSTGLQADRVPFSGAGTAVPALLGGEVQMMLTGVINAMSHIKAGKLRPIVVTGPERSEMLPDVPSISETGLQNYNDFVWFGMLVPDGTPKPIIDKLNSAAREALQDPEVRGSLEARTIRVADTTPEEFQEIMERDVERWEGLIEETGAKLDN